MKRLSRANLAEANDALQLPAFARDSVGAGQLHLGVGAFMRAHLAVYTDDALAAEGGDWGIAGVSLRHRAVYDQLHPQDGLYTVRIADDRATTHRLVGALQSVHVAPENPAAVIGRIADPRIAVVTLTVTEKGYSLEPDSGALDLDSPGIAGDLARPRHPTTTLGYLAAGLAERRAAGGAPVTLLSCDNLPGNGRRLQAGLRQYVERAFPEVLPWLDENTAYPATMVDRIVPATTAEDIEAAAATLGLRDEALVKTEPFTQWVIEDRFAGPRPVWEAGGALLVEDVDDWETAKLRLLNGPHSALAYLGYLGGHEFIHQAVGHADYARYARTLMTREIAPVTPEPDGMRHADYIEALLRRFANSTLAHRTWQIAMDGSQKLPQRLLNTVRAQLHRDGPIEAGTLAVAAWMRYTLGRDESGGAIDVQDPLAERLAGLGGGSADEITARFLDLREVFGTDLPADARFRAVLSRSLASLLERGAAASVHDCVAGAG